MSVGAGKGEGSAPSLAGGSGNKVGGHVSLAPSHHTADEGGNTGYAPLMPFGLAQLCPCLRGQLYCAAQAKRPSVS